MKLLLSNFGRIESAELEIRPLTVLVGKNSVNKTWAAYALHGLLQYLTWRKPAIVGVRSIGTTLIEIQSQAGREQIQAATRREIARLPTVEGAGTIDLDVSRRSLLGDVHEPTEFTLKSEPIRELLRLEGQLAPNARATLRLSPEELQRRDTTVSMQIDYAERTLQMRWTAGEPEVKLSMRLASDASFGDLRERAQMLLQAFAQRFLSMGMVLLLPAERKALSSTYNQTLQLESVDELLSRPVAAFTHFLASTHAPKRTRKGQAMPDLLKHLDARILGGEMRLDGAGPEQRLLFVPRGGSALPMHATSSIVGSLAGLDLYLRYAAREGDTLIIDEPEMNAHPESQVALVELLACLVNRGVRVVLTTHSPYIVDHLNNLIWARKLSEPDQEAAAKSFNLETKNCFLRQEDVAAYLFEAESQESPVQVKSIFQADDPEGLIDWDTFGRTSNLVSNLFSQEVLSRLPPRALER